MERERLNAPGPPAGETRRLAEHLFRHESGRLVAILTGFLGTDRLELAEDVVQEALGRALQSWPNFGIPENPAAWITRTAKLIAIDTLRRETVFQRKEGEIADTLERNVLQSLREDPPRLESEVGDETLRLMFVSCHPELSGESQVALALRTLCGFSTKEIASAFLTTEHAIAKRLTRARQRIRELALPFEIPAGRDLEPRLDGVLRVLYLLFNEGHKASHGERLVRDELCSEAIRLTTLLVEHPAGDKPHAHALLALMLFSGARLPARADADGNILRLKEQDRSLWNREMIQRGMHHLTRACTGEELTEYHLQAAIDAYHCTAHSDAATDWPAILARYDAWMEITDSPVVALNRAVALANVKGPQAGIDAVDGIRNSKALQSYYLLYAVLADFESQLGNGQTAARYYRKAIELTELRSERAFLERRLRECLGVAAEQTG